MRAYARGAFDEVPAVIYDFCAGRGAQYAKLNGHDPHAYLRDGLQRLPMHPASRIDDLLPDRWQPRT